jgi:hypothetical protein
MSHANSQSPRTRIETKGVQYLSDGELLVTLINSGLDRRALENPWNKRWESSTDSSLFRVIEELPSEPKIQNQQPGGRVQETVSIYARE